MLPVRFEGHRNSSGFRVSETPDGTSVYEVRDVYSVEPLVLEAKNLEDPLFVRFINCETDADYIRYLDRFDIGPKLGVEDTRAFRSIILERAERSLEEDHGPRAINELLAKAHLKLSVRLTDGASHFVLCAEGLGDLMTVEIATAAVAGARMRACEKCQRRFLVGPLTGRRVDARYCSDRCRMAAMRARKALGVEE